MGSVGVLLKERREARGLTQRELGDLAGMSETYISRIERGLVATPHRPTLQRLASSLDMQVSEFYLAGEVTTAEVSEDDPLASLQRKMALERPDVRAKLAQLKIKYADRPHVYETMERRILRAWGSNIDGITDTALDDA